MLPSGKDFGDFQDFFTQLDSCTEPMSEAWISEQLLATKNVMKEAGKEPSQEMVYEWTAFALWRLPNDEESPWGTHFGPFATWNTKDGGSQENPPRQFITLGAVQYWASRAAQVKHPILRLRYSELVWEFGQFLPEIKKEFKKSRIDFARRSIASAIDCANSRLHEHFISLVEITKRNLRLAKSIGDKAAERAMIECILRLHHTLKSEDGLAFRTFAFESLLSERSDLLSEAERLQLLHDLEEVFEKMLPEGADFGDPHGAEGVAQLLHDYHKRTGNEPEASKALVSAGKNFERVASVAGGLLAPGFYNKARVLFEQARDAQSEARAFKEMTEAGPESMKAMVSIGGKVEINEQELQELVSEFIQGDAFEALRLFAARLLPRKNKVTHRMKEIAESAPLQAFITKTLVDRDGIVRAVVGGIEEDPEGHLTYHYLQESALNSFYMKLIFEKICSHYSLDSDGIVRHLLASPVFDPASEEVLKRCIKAYLERDYIFAQHAMPAQVEHSVRRLLQSVGVNVNKVVNQGRYAGQVFQVRLLDDLLRDGALSAIFGGKDDVPYYLRFVLTDPRGLNLRNDAYHGLLVAEQFNQNNSIALVHTLLLLALVQKEG